MIVQDLIKSNVNVCLFIKYSIIICPWVFKEEDSIPLGGHQRVPGGTYKFMEKPALTYTVLTLWVCVCLSRGINVIL